MTLSCLYTETSFCWQHFFLNRLLRPQDLLHQTSCFISKVCFGLQTLVYRILNVVVLCRVCGGRQPLSRVPYILPAEPTDSGEGCKFTELLESSCTVHLKHSKNEAFGADMYKQCMTEGKLEQLFMFCDETVVFMNTCPTSEVYR